MAILVEIIFVATVPGGEFIGRKQEQKKVKKDPTNKIGGKTSSHITAEVGSHKPGEMNKRETGMASMEDTPGVAIRIIFIVTEIACDLRQIRRRLQGSSEKAFNWDILQMPNCGWLVSLT